MARVSCLRGKDDLSITGQTQTAWLVSVVREGHQAHLHIIIRGDKDLGCLSQEAILAAKLGIVVVEEDLLFISNH
jgi:hypothetical protein